MQKEKALENLSENYIIPLIWFCLVRKQSAPDCVWTKLYYIPNIKIFHIELLNQFTF